MATVVSCLNILEKPTSMKKYGALLVMFLFLAPSLDAQYRSIYFVGNAANQDDDWIDGIIQSVDPDVKTDVFFVGDFTDNDGIRNKPKKKNENRLKSFKRIKKETNGKLFFLSGDRDWDNSGPNGKKKVKHLEDYIEGKLKLKKSFIPSNACPGPFVMERDKRTTIIAINSQWFMHPHERPEAPDTDCSILFENDFWEELESLLDDAHGKNVIITAHHPIYSSGPHGGEKLGWKHFIPIYGQVYAAYKQFDGSSRDLSNPRYNHYVERMRSLIHDHKSVLYVSGHDFFNTVLEYDGNYYINTSVAKKTTGFRKNKHIVFGESKAGFVQLNLFKNGQVDLLYHHRSKEETEILTILNSCEDDLPNYNHQLNPCEKSFSGKISSKKFEAVNGKIDRVAGPEYKANGFTHFWMGRNYRPEWTATVKAPFLDLTSKYEGLSPYARGGGLQTNSLKFKAGDGQRYVFRAVDKNPERALDELTSQTLYRKVTKQLITTQHPYGGLVASYFLDHTDILHARPQLYVMPDLPALGPYRETFGGLLGTLEIKPRTNKKGKTFGEATAIVASNQMFRKMFKNNHNRIDRIAYGKARVFDMLVGDWDRHEDNWKWAEYKNDKGNIYKPIPRDRDHVFSKWEGVIPRIANQVIPNSTNFGYVFNNTWHLSYKAGHLDRRLGAELTRQEWMEACDYIQSKITDEVIVNGMAQLPPELPDVHHQEIIDKLKQRRDNLRIVVNQLLDIIEKEVDVVGSNVQEYFKITRLENGNVLVEMYDMGKHGKVKEKLFSREFVKGQTDEIYIYGLGGFDKVEIFGEVDKSIKVRIVPGDGKDEIIDHSTVAGKGKLSQVFLGKNEKDDVISSSETVIKRPHNRAEYDYHRFKLNGLIPFPGFRSGGANGQGYVMTLMRTRQGFNKPDFAHKYRIKFRYFPSIGAYRSNFDYTYRHLLQNWNFVTNWDLSNNSDRHPFFWGLGAQNEIDYTIQDQGYYDMDFEHYHGRIGLSQKIKAKSEWGFYVNSTYNDVNTEGQDVSQIFQENSFTNLLGDLWTGGLEFDVRLDFRDNSISTRDGALFEFNNQFILGLSNSDIKGGKVELSLTEYQTYQVLRPITLLGRVGYVGTYGDLPFFQRAILGGRTFLRGYENNQFIDDQAMVLNLEARLELGTWYNLVVPITFGVFGFNDSGNVWSDKDGFLDNKWSQSKGVGVYAAPYNRNFTFSGSWSRNDFGRDFYDIKLGFDL